MKNQRKDHQLKSLTGSIGLVLLMFIGRETITKRVVDSLTKLKIVDEDVVYQYTKKLEKMRLLEVVEVKRNRRGKPRFLTANTDAVLNYISNHSMSELSHTDLNRLKPLFTSIANNTLEFYPKYLLSSLEKRKISNLEFRKILSNFILFSLDYINSCWLLIRYPRFLEPNLKRTLKNWKRTNSEEISREPYQSLEHLMKISSGLPSKIRKMEYKEIEKIASMMKEPEDIIGDTFTGKLFFTSLTLENPRLAARLNSYLNRINRNQTSNTHIPQ